MDTLLLDIIEVRRTIVPTLVKNCLIGVFVHAPSAYPAHLSIVVFLNSTYVSMYLYRSEKKYKPEFLQFYGFNIHPLK